MFLGQSLFPNPEPHKRLLLGFFTPPLSASMFSLLFIFLFPISTTLHHRGSQLFIFQSSPPMSGLNIHFLTLLPPHNTCISVVSYSLSPQLPTIMARTKVFLNSPAHRSRAWVVFLQLRFPPWPDWLCILFPLSPTSHPYTCSMYSFSSAVPPSHRDSRILFNSPTIRSLLIRFFNSALQHYCIEYRNFYSRIPLILHP